MRDVVSLPLRAWLPLLLASQLTACSFFAMERASSHTRPDTMPRCSAATMPLVADGAMALGFGVVSAMAISDRNSSDSQADVDDAGDVLWMTIPIVLVTAASLYYGVTQRSRCDDARAAHESWLIGHPLRRPLVMPPAAAPPPAAPAAPAAPPESAPSPAPGPASPTPTPPSPAPVSP